MGCFMLFPVSCSSCGCRVVKNNKCSSVLWLASSGWPLVLPFVVPPPPPRASLPSAKQCCVDSLLWRFHFCPSQGNCHDQETSWQRPSYESVNSPLLTGWFTNYFPSWEWGEEYGNGCFYPCNVLCMGLPLKVVGKPQLVWNAAARMLTGISRQDQHITNTVFQFVSGLRAKCWSSVLKP